MALEAISRSANGTAALRTELAEGAGDVDALVREWDLLAPDAQRLVAQSIRQLVDDSDESVRLAAARFYQARPTAPGSESLMDAFAVFGSSVSLQADMLAVGAPGEA